MARRRRSRSLRVNGRLRDPGPDASGNYSVSPYAARGHLVEIAPKELRSNPNSDAFPKRIATQRVIDRYLARGNIERREWQAAEALWTFWVESGLELLMTSNGEFNITSANGCADDMIGRKIDGATRFVELMALVPYHSRGCVRAVVIEDRPAGDWAIDRGDNRHHGITRLRAGLQALALHLGY